MNTQFSFIILTYNEEIHLPRLLKSISDLEAPVFILDSGSTDKTIETGEQYGAHFLQHAFENHPKQWDFALKNFPVTTPWVICLDADQTVTPELSKLLADFKDEVYPGIDGIYFNRKNFFKGQWIKHGGYYPFYMLKMFRFGLGYSDTNENMDHRFVIPGKSAIWKDGIILEENLKENHIRFWIDKHNRYSDQVAREEVERMQQAREQVVKPNFRGSPDERTAWKKQLWWKLPRYTRPILYFTQRFIFQLGILDGRTGIIFHFLQAFWFRLIVDIKIDELLKDQAAPRAKTGEPSPLRFILSFIILFLLFYYFNILFFGLTTPGNHYNPFLAAHLNYISALRHLLLYCSAGVLNLIGFSAITNNYEMLVAGHGVIQLVYSCLGLGVLSFFCAFVLAYPGKWRPKFIFMISGIIIIELLNILRFILLALFWDKHGGQIIDHHVIFNTIIYIIVAVSLYFWVKHSDKRQNGSNAAN